jgi:hypothetical protein
MHFSPRPKNLIASHDGQEKDETEELPSMCVKVEFGIKDEGFLPRLHYSIDIDYTGSIGGRTPELQ